MSGGGREEFAERVGALGAVVGERGRGFIVPGSIRSIVPVGTICGSNVFLLDGGGCSGAFGFASVGCRVTDSRRGGRLVRKC